MKPRKACKIVFVAPHIRQYLKLEDYLVLHDNWVTGDNNTLFDEDGNEYLVMEMKEAVIYEFIKDPTDSRNGHWGLVKHSAVMLDEGSFEVGDILYTEGVD